MLSGRHAGYQIYPCRDGRVALAALEPHFARALCALVGITPFDANTMMAPATQELIATYLSGKTRKALETLARQHDIPLHTLAK
jgi:crotonobetainyl-CoA:carnitine CoA-transferase CaiB-like acyl-CoA transferase